MAKYLVYRPFYAAGVHYAPSATTARPEVVELPDSHVPSVTWEAMDEVGLKAINAVISDTLKLIVVGVPKDKVEAVELAAKKRMRFGQRKIVGYESPKEKAEPSTNTEINEGKSRVVGRLSDKSPV